MSDTDFIHKPNLTSWSRDANVGFSAAPEVRADNNLPSIPLSILEFLAIIQRLELDILPLTWQPALSTIGEGATAYIWQSQFVQHDNFAFKRMRPATKVERVWSIRALIAEVTILGQPSIRTHPSISPLQGICWDVDEMTDEAWPVLVFGKANNGDLDAFMESRGPRLQSHYRVALCFVL
ncbi:hypothetical protein BDW69DRAFT_9065 [Aspergillus filifer]